VELQDSLAFPREVRSTFKVEPKTPVTAYTQCSAAVRSIIESNLSTYERLAKAKFVFGEPPSSVTPFLPSDQGAI